MRLFDILQSLRRRRMLVTAAELADELGVSTRTIYRDVAALVARGVPIEGEAGLGYVLRDGLFLPPLSFNDDEADAVVLGLRWVEKRADPQLAKAAADALAKITALPGRGREAANMPGVFVGPDKDMPSGAVGIGLLRDAVRECRLIDIEYVDRAGSLSRRRIWPIGLAFMEDMRMVVAWCELRGAFRHFRIDRLASAKVSGVYPGRRAILLQDWRRQLEGEEKAADRNCQQDVLAELRSGEPDEARPEGPSGYHGGGEPARS
jgi:predicted DNA-binding transcriptional regulator YafY